MTCCSSTNISGSSSKIFICCVLLSTRRILEINSRTSVEKFDLDAPKRCFVLILSRSLEANCFNPSNDNWRSFSLTCFSDINLYKGSTDILESLSVPGFLNLRNKT